MSTVSLETLFAAQDEASRRKQSLDDAKAKLTDCRGKVRTAATKRPRLKPPSGKCWPKCVGRPNQRQDGPTKCNDPNAERAAEGQASPAVAPERVDMLGNQSVFKFPRRAVSYQPQDLRKRPWFPRLGSIQADGWIVSHPALWSEQRTTGTGEKRHPVRGENLIPATTSTTGPRRKDPVAVARPSSACVPRAGSEFLFGVNYP